MTTWSRAVMSVMGMCAYPRLVKLGYLLYDKVLLPIPAANVAAFLTRLAIDDMKERVRCDVRNACVSAETADPRLSTSLFREMWRNISDATFASAETPAMLRNVIRNLAAAGTRVLPFDEVKQLKRGQLVNVMAVGHRLRATATIAAILESPVLAIPDEISVLSGLPQEFVAPRDPTGYGVGIVRAILPDAANLPWDVLYRLRHSDLMPTFRRWLARKVAAPTEPPESAFLEDLLELAAEVEPDLPTSTVLAIVCNIPTGPVPNPASLAAGTATVCRALKLKKRFAHLFLLAALRRAIPQRETRGGGVDAIAVDRRYVRVTVPEQERSGNWWTDTKGRELVPNIHPFWIQTARIGEMTHLIGSTQRGLYHHLTCRCSLRIPLRHIVWFRTEEEAKDLNWKPCKLCRSLLGSATSG